MIKTGCKKNINVFFAVFIVFFLGFNFTTALEIEYPDLSTGATVTPDTPLPKYLKYVFDFGIFAGFFAVFLSLVWAGVLYLMSPAKPDLLASAKDRVFGAITGLLILATLYLIVTTINPQLKFFRLDELDAIPPPPEPERQAGVYFYDQSNCKSSGAETLHTISVPHLDLLANRVRSVGTVHNSGQDIYYISVLYDSPNFWGKCQYINPNKPCVSVEPFAVSASIHHYDFSPKGEGVIFYRKSFYNDNGGWRKIPNSDIKKAGIYTGMLSELKFTDKSEKSSDNPEGCTVPKEERDCVSWNKKGECQKRQCPSLAGENITSVEIKGDYMVLFVYLDVLLDKEVGSFSFCQEFPTKDDANKDGPKQIKWENVRNPSDGRLPNWVVIFPVKQK